MNPLFIKELQAIVGEPYTLSDPESLAVYGYDATPELENRPGVVLLPGTTDEITRIMGICHNAGVSVTPRGSGTNLSGGSIAGSGSVIIQTSRLNRIIEMDEENLTATVEPGVITSTLHREVEARGPFYPPDPGSMNISTMGGNVAESYPGPSLIIAYATCVNHGIKQKMGKAQLQSKNAVEAGYWSLYRFNPLLKDQGENPFILDSKDPVADFEEFLLSEVRYAALSKQYPDIAQDLFKKAKKDAMKRIENYKRLSRQVY